MYANLVKWATLKTGGGRLVDKAIYRRQTYRRCAILLSLRPFRSKLTAYRRAVSPIYHFCRLTSLPRRHPASRPINHFAALQFYRLTAVLFYSCEISDALLRCAIPHKQSPCQLPVILRFIILSVSTIRHSPAHYHFHRRAVGYLYLTACPCPPALYHFETSYA